MNHDFIKELNREIDEQTTLMEESTNKRDHYRNITIGCVLLTLYYNYIFYNSIQNNDLFFIIDLLLIVKDIILFRFFFIRFKNESWARKKILNFLNLTKKQNMSGELEVTDEMFNEFKKEN